LKSVDIPANVELLGDSCFLHRSSLSGITFESGSKLLRFGSLVFSNCSSLKLIFVPATVEHLGHSCFIH
jgi:hypothetical protein